MLNMVNITLTWFHNYMKPQNNTKKYKIKCSWEKFWNLINRNLS